MVKEAIHYFLKAWKQLPLKLIFQRKIKPGDFMITFKEEKSCWKTSDNLRKEWNSNFGKGYLASVKFLMN